MEPIEIVREGYAAFNRGDVARIANFLSPDIVWEDAKEMPEPGGVRSGLEHVTRYLRSLHRMWDEIRFEPEEMEQISDREVLSSCRVIARGRASGAEVDAAVVHLFEIRGGCCCHVRTFFDRAEAEAASAAARAPGGQGAQSG